MRRDFVGWLMARENIKDKIQELKALEMKLQKESDGYRKKKLAPNIEALWKELLSNLSSSLVRSQVATAIQCILENNPVDKHTNSESFKEYWTNNYVVQNSKNPTWMRLEHEKVKTLKICQSIQNVNLINISSSCLALDSFYVKFQFRLIEPLLTKDESGFYIIDAPVRKDKVLGLPVMESTSWKGCLRRSIRQWKGLLDKEQERNDHQMMRLFGNIKTEEDEKQFRAGRLIFYPTFFHCFGLDIINPHNRETKVGETPIQMEVVPIGTTATFTILYFPFDRIGREEANIEHGVDKTLKDEAAEDIIEIAEGIKAMFTHYGFGAKTSSGFGTSEIIKDSIDIQANDNGELSDEIIKAKEILGRKEDENE